MSTEGTLRAAAQAVLDRWDSPQWQWTKQSPTADLMANLRAALDADLNVQVKSAITQVQAVHAAFNAGALQQPAASGEPVAAECDSPKLCALNGACAGQYGTKQQCAAPQPAPAPAELLSLQRRVREWTVACFGEAVADDKQERSHRFLEEALELVQACGCTASEAHQLVEYVFGRPASLPTDEVGDVMTTLAALANAHGIDTTASAEATLLNCWAKIDKIRAKWLTKPKHSPLPATAQPAPAPAAIRAAFEAWASEQKLALNRHHHSYAATSTAWCWDAWHAAQPSPARVPPGWQLVPVEPTWGMTRAAIRHMDKPEPRVADIDMAYRAMLAAAPPPQQEPKP